MAEETTKKRKPKDAPALGDRLLIDAPGAAALASVTVRHWHTLNSSGKVPAPVRLGGSVRWSVPELRAWLAAGCPARDKWEVMREQVMEGVPNDH